MCIEGISVGFCEALASDVCVQERKMNMKNYEEIKKTLEEVIADMRILVDLADKARNRVSLADARFGNYHFANDVMKEMEQRLLSLQKKISVLNRLLEQNGIDQQYWIDIGGKQTFLSTRMYGGRALRQVSRLKKDIQQMYQEFKSKLYPILEQGEN